MPLPLALLLAAAAIAVLVAVQVRHTRRVRVERRAVLDEVVALLSGAEVVQDGIGFPRVSGLLDGERVKVELVVDALAMRGLPTLWLVVTLPREVAIADPVEIVMRPRTPDMLSPAGKLRYEHEPPAGWPHDVRIATARPDPPPLHALRDWLGFLRDPRVKSLLVGPGGVRVVQELGRGDVGRYRVTRRAKFDVALREEHFLALVGVARGVAQDVELAAELDALLAGASAP
jgi:hypothetical protein